MKSNHKSVLIFFLLPAVFSLFYIVASTVHLLDESIAGILETLPFPVFTIILTIILMVFKKKIFLPLRLRDNYAYTILGFMAPTALLSAWTLAASHLGGVAWGGIHYFLEAVTRYPNFGSVNSTVILSMIALLCISFLPVIIAWGYLSFWPKRTMYVLALFAIISYLTVAVNLDFNLWLAGLYGIEQDSLRFLLYGPISRTLAIISVCYFLIRLMFDHKQE